MQNTYQQDRLQRIAEAFIADAIVAIVPHGEGHIHNTFKVSTQAADEAYILQRINTNVFGNLQAIMQNIQTLNTHLLTKKEYPYEHLTPLQTMHGGDTLFVETVKGNPHYWRVFPFVKNCVSLADISISPDIAYQTAMGFGTFVAALADLSVQRLHTTIPNFHNPQFRWQQLQQACHKDSAKRLRSVQAELRIMATYYSIIQNYTPDSLLTVTHNDAKVSNILFDKQALQPRCIIDLDTVMAGEWLFDFGDMVRTTAATAAEDESDTSKVSVNVRIYQSLLAGYCDALKELLTPYYKQRLGLGAQLVTFTQAIRFLTDYLCGDTYYHTKYEQHNLIRTRNQLQLLRSIQELLPV
ncbi:MAG: aminoglycoside phosphotransferase family protein [Saprospiraceae bacterium]|nr:aminoglycoside phosphotransferase family protein [Saprospiraceae bacterium]MBP7680091.1 aminoglycoside phosphotransferase family protein [Saprospiraceae bacterium]